MFELLTEDEQIAFKDICKKLNIDIFGLYYSVGMTRVLEKIYEIEQRVKAVEEK